MNNEPVALRHNCPHCEQEFTCNHPAKTLTDEEIKDIGYKFGEMGLNLEMIKTILRKAQEK